MKTISLVLAIAIAPVFGFSQSIFDKYEDMDDVGSVTINQNMIRLAGNIAAFDESDQEAQDFADIAQGLEGIKVFITENPDISEDMGEAVRSYLKSSTLEELMRVKDKDATVKFYVKQGRDEDHVSELLLFVSDIENSKIGIKNRKFESVLVSMTGDIDLKKIGALTKKMNLPEELNEAGK
jgi:calcineurin-like phosphoesterase family protein